MNNLSVSVDNAVSSLVEGIANTQRRHRLTILRYNELENKLSLSKTDNSTLKEKKSAAAAKEKQLKEDLEKITKEQENLQLLIMNESDRFCHCEMEEPLLEKHVDQQIAGVEQQIDEWSERAKRLDDLAGLLERDSSIKKLKEELKKLEANIRDMTEAKREVEDELDNVNRDIRHEQAKQNQQKYSFYTNNLLNREKEFFMLEEESLDEFMESNEVTEFEWYQTLSQMFRQLQSIRRNADDLDRRHYELSRWYNDMTSSKKRYEDCLVLLDKCVGSRLCPKCVGSGLLMLKGLRNRMKRDNEPRILILGLDNSGKTTILNTLGVAEEHPTASAPEGPTQGFNIKDLIRNGKRAKLCDLGGQRALRDFWQDYYANTDCIMYVVDSSDTRRLDEAVQAFSAVIEGVPGVPVLIFANKQDLSTAKDPQAVALALQLSEFRDRKWHIQGCSAKTGQGLEDGITWIMEACTGP